jgi:hypothetical protein
MSNYGRYFEFRNSPRPENRYGRALSPNAVIPIGAPVVAGTAAPNADGRSVYALKTGGQTGRPLPVKNGLAIFEHSYNAYAGFDTELTVPSDFSDIPANSPIQVCHGTNIKVVFRNITADTVFLGQRTYDDARVMIAPGNLGTLGVGDFIVPGTGDGTSGYWAEGGDADTAWFQITSVDTARGEVEAQMLF